MTDNQLMQLLISVIQNGLTLQNISVGIKQSRQPTQQGVPATPYVFIAKIGDHRYGFPQRSDVYDTVAGSMNHSETEAILTMYQVSALAIQDPSNIVSLTASDYLNAVSASLQIESAVQILTAAGSGIERIQALKQTYFKDEKGKFEASPILEFTVSHTRAVTYPIGSTIAIVPQILST